MTLSPVPVETFGGLNLQSDPGSAGWGSAIDLLNVDFDTGGRVRSRDGYSQYSTALSAPDLYSYGGVTDERIAVAVSGSATVKELLGTTGAASNTYAIAAGAKALTSFGTATNHYYYAASAATLDRLTPKTTTVFNVASAPGGTCMAIQQPDNRMVLGKSDKVWFSNAGNADTWGVNDFVTLRPGDGDSIRAMAVYNSQLLVFKERGIWSFYGNTIDGSGNPVFNVREVDDSNGVFTDNPPHAVAVAPHGVYFPGKDGIYITRGGPAERVSTPLDPLFKQTTNSFYTGTTISTSGISLWGSSMCWFNNRLYVSVKYDSTHYFTLVYSPQDNYWTLWDVAGKTFAVVPATISTVSKLVFGAGTSIFALDPTVTTDNGTAITSRYRTGFSDLGSSDMKRVHSWRATGSGSPTLKLSTDLGSLETGAALTLGTSPAVAEAVRRYAPRGRRFSWQLGATSAWSVNNLTAEVAGRRKSGEHAT